VNSLGAMFLSALFAFIARLPRSVAFTLGEAFGRLAHQVAWLIGRNRIGMTNLRLVFGHERRKGEFRRILKEMWINFGRNAVEFALFPRYTKENIGRYVTWENIHHLEEARERGHGILTMTAHFGNWDLLALSAGMEGFPVNLVTKYMRSKTITDLWMKWRARGGVNPIFKKEARREVVRILRENRLVAFVVDQDTKPKEGGIFVEFFGVKASTLSAPALLSEKRDTPVIPVFLVRESRYRHRAVVEPPIHFENVGGHEENLVHNTRRYLAVLERYVRQYPEQWLWVHRRWRRRPPGEEPVYTGAAAKRRKRHPDGVPHNS
jgi:KDO2-lipid IV(A) lauroyltransferase